MAVDTKPVEVSEESIVSALAEDVAIHGWKVTSFAVSQDIEKEERQLSVKLRKSTGQAKQENMDLRDGEKPTRGRRQPADNGGDAA